MNSNLDKKNVIRNDKGQVVLGIDDEWRDESEWAVERPCTILESLEESLKQMKAMRKGEMPKKTWRDFKKELKKHWK
jgi:hypothetical protein